MPWYIGRRVLQMVPVFFGATLLIYAMVFAMPGDPIAALAGDKPLPPEQVAALRAQYHLDDPFLVQYWEYLKGVFTLDLGDTFSGRSVADEIALAFPVTFKLALMAILIETVLGIGIGVAAGMRKGGLFDSTVLVASLLVIATPTFVLGFVARYLFGVRWGVVSPTVGGDATVAKLLLPAFVLGLVSVAYVLRLTRSEVAANRHADFVRTARAKGLPSREVTGRHILRNSLIPVVTFIGADLAALMGGAIVTEGIFNIPGIGGLVFHAVQIGEAPTVVSVVTILVILYMAANLLIDLLYAALDPRIRYA
ncbi:ABC transporter permease [Corynebacterium sphenisci DSM 44792]|uniref:ABC transporter permease n=1 Tax=Corynebacterium sphenisci DSM 44792 TaxID=1437874 RepID=A0A1L7CVX9_9CORY|nr:ABC transporter permease [Corynebacterium sphenisci]APT90036.1 ABC transporter permease [Corynebacterium sphenisci DSM 44792]